MLDFILKRHKENPTLLSDPYRAIFERENSLVNIAHLRFSSILFIFFLLIILLNNAMHGKGLSLSYPYFYFNLLYILNILLLIFFLALFLLIEHHFIKSILAIHGIILSFAIAMLLYSVLIAMLDQSISGQIIIYMLISLALAVGVVEKPSLLFPAFFFAQIVFVVLLPLFQKVPKVLISNMINSFLLILLSLYISRMFYQSRIQSYLHEKKLEAANNDLTQLNEKLTTTMNTLMETQSLLLEKEKMAVLGSLIAGVTHEINTPLAVVKSNINLQKLLIDSLFESKNHEDFGSLKDNASTFSRSVWKGSHESTGSLKL